MAEQSRPSRADAVQNRARVMAAARAVLAERGMAAEVADIAAAAGLGTGTLYRHFPNKEALIRSVVEDLALETVKGTAAIHEIEDAREAVTEGIHNGARLLDEFGLLYRQLLDGQGQQYLQLFDMRAIYEGWADVMRRGIRQGYFRADLDVDHAVIMLLSLFAPRALPRLIAERGDPHRVAEEGVRFFLAGVSAEPQD